MHNKYGSRTRCDICNRFQGRWPIDGKIHAHEHKGQGTRSFISSGTKWPKVLKSAESCYVCDILIKGCRGCFEQHNIVEADIATCDIKFRYPNHIEDEEDLDAEKIVILHLKNGQRFEVEMFATEDDDCPIPDSWERIPVSSRIVERTDSLEALEKINGWIANCFDECAYCDSPELPELPSRVIDVSMSDGIVRLVETNKTRAKYICLSHCWGLEQIITTTKSTYEDRKKAIDWEQLSRTFQDAITLTKRLGFDYVWIDSICIVQDDARDWEIESAKMASIYSNGQLTIAATHSSSGRGGLFSQHSDVKVQGQTPDGEDYCLFFRQVIDHQVDMMVHGNGWDSTALTFPLLSRAWLYQERMLSTRVIHFGRHEMFYECKSGVECECTNIGYAGQGPGIELPLVKVEYANVLSNYDTSSEDIQEKKDIDNTYYHGARIWRSMVCCYTSLLLTMSKDRLPAIGGLARQMAGKRQSRYFAGLWSDTMNDDLTWKVTARSNQKKPRPNPRNAPTWSWASVETFVDYEDAIAFTSMSDVEELRPLSQHFSVIRDCHVTASAVGEFGPIAGGTITITGLVAEGVLERSTEACEDGQRVLHYLQFSTERVLMDADYLLDHKGPDFTPPSTPVLCLRMSSYEADGGGVTLISLVLKKASESPEKYERIGSSRFRGKKDVLNSDGGIFEGVSSCTLVIV